MSEFADLLSRSAFALRLPQLMGSAVDGGDSGSGDGGHGAPSAPPDAAAAAEVTVPIAAAAASNQPNVGYRAVVFEKPHSDTVDGPDLVGSRRRVTVSCRLCPSVVRLLASGYGEMARRAEAAGWQYTPGRHLHDRAWCPRCRPNAEKAVD
ncbi:hypothetical protein [Glycomyces paridis]|uniref:Uncharacterized protein n=1 Tax=Glycomyces paridis TaxID=2126555 RepID=A0A4S8P5B4_9ACTN|nr:hypothetical protein [Glycomyces paridis]THV24485.1 hypothetical protein E9998_20945 [Glycomyces paridis]